MAENPSKVDFNDLLHYDPATGVLTHHGTRVIITGTTNAGSLRKYLLASYDPEEIREKYWKAGYDQGYTDVLAIARTLDISEDFDFVKLGSAMMGVTGAARTEIERVDLNLTEGRVSIRARFLNSHEAIEYLRQVGPSLRGACWIRAGYAQGFLEGILDKPVLVVETECLAMGDPSCAFVITTDALESAEAAAAVAARTPGSPPPRPVASGMADEGPVLSAAQIQTLATHISPKDKQRLIDYFSRKDSELERSRLRYRALLDASPDVVLEVSKEGSVMLANESARSMLGRDPTDLVGQRIPSLFVAEDRAAVENLLSTLPAGPTVVLSRVRFHDGVGQTRVAELAVRALEQGAAGATKLVEIRDVTDRAQLEAQLLEREARRRAVFESAADGILLWGKDGIIGDANPAADKMFGYKPGELKGVPVDEVIRAIKVPPQTKEGGGQRPEARPRPVSVRKLPERRWVGDAEIHMRRGDVRSAIVSITPLTSGVLKGSRLALVKDLSEIEALREELRVEKGKTDTIVEAISEPMIIFNERSEVEWHNAHAEFVFGRRKVIHGTPCHLIACDRSEPCEECPVAEFQRSTHNPGTVRRRRPIKTTDGGEHPFELTMRRLPTQRKAPRSLVVFRDVAAEAGSERAVLERLQRGDLHLEVSDLLLSSRAMPEMLERFADRVAAALNLSTVAVLLRTSGDWLEPVAVYQGGAAIEGVAPRIAASTTGLKDVLDKVQSRLIRDTDKSAGALSLQAVLEREGAAGSSSLLMSPLLDRAGAVLGVLVGGRSEVDAFENEDIELWEGIAMRLGLALDGVLLAEASLRVLKLQQALIAQADVLMGSGDWKKNALRFLEVLCQSTGAPSAGLVYRSTSSSTARLFLAYTREDRHFSGPGAPVPLRSCPILSRKGVADEVQVIDLRTLRESERQDPVVRELITDGSETLVLIPSGVRGAIAGWIALTMPAGFRISTPSEFEVLRNLGQQSQLALSALLASGKIGDLRAILEGEGFPSA